MKTKLSVVYVALACIISGCGEKNAPPPVAAADKTQPSAALPATQPNIAKGNSKKPVQLAGVFDFDSLMNRIPTNEFTLSEEGGWDKFTMPKVQKWVSENLYGKRMRIPVAVTYCDVTQEDANSKPDEWTVSLKVAGIHANYVGIANRILPIDKEDGRIPYLHKDKGTQNAPPPSIGIKDEASFTFKCTEAEARKWDAHNKTLVPAVTVEGDILGISFQPHLDVSLGDFIGYDIFVQLENVAVTPSKDTEPGVLHACEVFLDNTLEHDSSLNIPYESITEIKRLDSSGDYQLIFLKYRWWRNESNGSGGKQYKTKLLSANFNDTKGMTTPCDDPPTESQISEAKAKVGWPNN